MCDSYNTLAVYSSQKDKIDGAAIGSFYINNGASHIICFRGYVSKE